MTKKYLSVLFAFFILFGSLPAAQAQTELDRLNQPKPQDFGNVKTADGENSAANQQTQMTQQAKDSESKKNPWSLRPYFKQGFKLTNNVFHDPNGDKSLSSPQTTRKMDAIWTETPGISAAYAKGTTLVGVSYEADFNYFTKYSGQNAQNQTAGGVLQLQPTENTFINATESFQTKELTSGFINLKPVSVTQNHVNVQAGYKTGRLSSEIGYGNFVRSFHSDVYEQFNYAQNEYSLAEYYELTDHWTPFVKEKIIQVDYSHDEEARDALASDSRAGVLGHWAKQRLFIRADAGAYIRDNRHSELRNDPDYFVTSFFIRKKVLKNTALETGFYREPRESTFGTATIYAENAFYFGISHPVTKKLTARGNVIWAMRRYPDAVASGADFMKRRDDSVALDLGMDYEFSKNVALRVDYKVERQNSNFHEFDYTENSLLTKLILAL